METRDSDRSLVIGASMARLVKARVLADHVDRVTVLERPAEDSVELAPMPAQLRMVGALGVEHRVLMMPVDGNDDGCGRFIDECLQDNPESCIDRMIGLSPSLVRWDT